MKMYLSFVPPGGGETDYSLPFDLPEIPRAGDYISILRTGSTGAETFRVRRTWWNLTTDETRTSHSGDDERVGKCSDIWVECEFAAGPYSSEDHKRACDAYEARGKGKIKLDESMY